MNRDEKYRIFISEYLKDFNASRAARAAGSQAKRAAQAGHELLTNPDVQKLLREAMSERVKNLEVTQENVIRELAAIAFSDLKHVASWTGDTLILKPSEGLDPTHSSAIESVGHSHTKDGGSIKIKLHNKTRALELLGEHLGIFKRELSLPGVQTFIIERPGGGETEIRFEAAPAKKAS